ncbi:MAG TPA: Gfo/Idh/MocA family oxidoreductase [Planctomycetota bacterium]|nr:Gfo/Idh/MocA family oxidoreductase [Planctomycetota bacterium]
MTTRKSSIEKLGRKGSLAPKAAPGASKGQGRVRYAVVGLGYIAQTAILPSFQHAKTNSELVALVSDDPKKRDQLSRRYKVAKTYDYEQYDECLASGEVDAVLIALPNSMHREYAVRAAIAGVHILCEKPLAVTEDECEAIILAAAENNVKLMTAYRLHFEAANLRAIEIVRGGKLGEPRIFDSVFTMQVNDPDNIRLQSRMGGGVLHDIGIYCINAARYLFQSEPIEVFACRANNGDPRFTEVDEMVSACLRFPEERLASFTASFGAADVSMYRVVGTKGSLLVDRAYEYAEGSTHHLTIGSGAPQTRKFPKRDQFGAEVVYFSDCIQKDKRPEPSGSEGIADVRIIEALNDSIETGASKAIDLIPRRNRPSVEQEIQRPAIKKPRLIHANSPSKS